jgi:Tfp pilus assembly protein PilF
MQPDVAERALISVLALSPHSAEANRLMGIVAQMRGEWTQAVNFLRQALENCPRDATILMNLGSSLYEIGAIEEALASLKLACQVEPKMAAAWYNLGKALKSQALIEPACFALQKALALDPTHVSARISLADAQINLGNIDEGVAQYRHILRKHPNNHDAWYALANLKTVSFSAREATQLNRLLFQPGASTDARIAIGFTLAKALEDQQDYSAAFKALHAANALKRRHVVWDALKQRNHVEATIRAFAVPACTPPDPTLGQEVIFIIGLPRSGSTLIEQILASHSEVEGANEITDLPQVIDNESARRGRPFTDWVNVATEEDWSRLGKEYLERTKRWRQLRPRHTDKNLVTWELVGAIRYMLPGAKIVSSRRDALETCFACYRQLFSNGAHFSYDLDTESNILALLDYCRLPFDPVCLDFHKTSRVVLSTASAAQVRQPLRAERSRSTMYTEELDSLRARLSSVGASAERT